MTTRPKDQARDDLREYARRLVADWPPLTPDQRTRLAVLLRPSTTPAVSQDAAA